MAGGTLEDNSELEHFIAMLRFGFAVERLFEGGHALVNRGSALASHRSEAFDSLALRMCDIRRRLEADSGFIKELTTLLDSARSPNILVKQLGMEMHPAALADTSAWDKVYRRIVYRSDPVTVHAEPAPELRVGASSACRRLGPPACAIGERRCFCRGPRTSRRRRA